MLGGRVWTDIRNALKNIVVAFSIILNRAKPWKVQLVCSSLNYLSPGNKVSCIHFEELNKRIGLIDRLVKGIWIHMYPWALDFNNDFNGVIAYLIITTVKLTANHFIVHTFLAALSYWAEFSIELPVKSSERHGTRATQCRTTEKTEDSKHGCTSLRNKKGSELQIRM